VYCADMSENDKYNEEYNIYVITDGIWAKIDAQVNTDILDICNAKMRKKIRQRGGMIRTADAVKLVLKEDRQELIDDIVQNLRKEGHPLLADAFKNEETREDAIRVLRLMLIEMEDPN
jgi:hypothetical protein